MHVTFSPAPLEPVTTKREIWAWYSFAFAVEAYVVVALTSFIPITLEALASEKGHLYGTNEPCNSLSNSTLVNVDRPRCMISFGQIEIDTASFVLYLTSLAVFLQALTVVSISSMADYGSYRKKQLVFFSIVGATATMLIGAVSLVGLAGALSVIANVSFGAGFVCFNAYLPLLVRNIEHIRKKSEQIQTLEGEINSFSGGEIDDITIAESESAALLPGAAGLNEQGDDVIAEGEQGAGSDLAQKKARLLTSKSQLAEEKAQIMGQISARGFASGYFGGILLLLVCLTISYLDKSSARSLKFGIFLSGLWWLAFAALAGVWLKRRPGRELRLEDSGAKRGSLWVASRYVLYSWSRMKNTIVQASQLPSAFRFLVAWFFLSDGYTSIANVALLFAKTTLRLPQTQLILLSLIAPIFALLGTLFFPRVQQIFKMSQKQMVLLLLFLLAMVPLYGVLGLLLPFFPKLNTATELFALAMYFGFLLGAVQSFCRSMFADLIPRGRESEFFGLYAITDKGSSWLGPLAVAAITDYTHDIRYSFFFLMVLLGLPFPIIYFGVDMEKGRQEADKASKELEAAQNADTVDQDEEQDSLLSPA